MDGPCIACIVADAEESDPIMRRLVADDPIRAIRLISMRTALSVLGILYSGEGTIPGMMAGLCRPCQAAMAYAKGVRAARDAKGGG